MEEESDRDAQAVPLLNATSFGAIDLALGRQPIGMPFHAEVDLTQAIEAPCQTLKQQRRTTMYVPPASYFGVACRRRYPRALRERSRSRGSTPDGAEWLWGEGRGYGLGRWARWKKRFWWCR
ncbi:hypothetical protein HO173_012270 [Letharia columbiana]|uniref:Uncharacterized protein n=1 Tax=Letharia columbiana TaxID=112416 RepID=A0A8H6CP36_9LECA|nr:uncharacterized protein HO173_012270 [Letharia columbiana]KAF6226766.1 hypothetical protein HO173_012270 [Letharia columbiana]